jgi:hypothetical protein
VIKPQHKTCGVLLNQITLNKTAWFTVPKR